MENSNKKSYMKILGVLIILAVILAAVSYFSSDKKVTEPTITGGEVSYGTSPLSSLPKALLYSVKTDKQSYLQNEQVVITIMVLNNTSETKTFNFPNGCQGTYEVGDFNLLEHTDCLAQPSSFVVASQQAKEVKLVHYPTLYSLPLGKQTIKASIVGYGEATAQVTINK